MSIYRFLPYVLLFFLVAGAMLLEELINHFGKKNQ